MKLRSASLSQFIDEFDCYFWSQRLSPIGRDDAAGRNVLMFLPTATTPLDRGLVLMLAIMIVVDFIESHMVFLWQSFVLIRMVRSGSSCSFCFDVYRY